MGSSDCAPNSNSDECPQHPVTIQPFWMGRYEVTFDEYSAFVLDMDRVEMPHDQNWGRGTRPVINVRWNEAKAYAKWLKKVTGQPFRLPTEAEWEYAARSGGKPEKYAGGDNLDKLGWYSGNSNGTTQPVGQKLANGLGIYDMSGNVWEWCQDWYDGEYYKNSPDKNPRGPATGAFRVVRGGSWNGVARYCRSAYRRGPRPKGTCIRLASDPTFPITPLPVFLLKICS
jgi:formylglycine-generating enzyme required for sulfatase activity